jgi:dTDP-glucose pyrophosphorylase/CBS domain-containing protein|tara:strand:- start:1511 stop:2548 length:1038 start_codon:yes stop_codon:yes gene_type:complete
MNREAIIKKDSTIKVALQTINNLSGQTLFVVNEEGKMVGTISDGDIRRALINDFTTSSSIAEVMSTNFRFLRINSFSSERLAEFKKSNIQYVPLLNEQDEIEDIINLKNLKSVLPLEAIIMAGGKGTRLKPHTLSTPKPLLEINGKPIIEYNIDRLIQFGVKKIYISVNYLKEQIKEYFGNGSSKGISIEYIEETEITGTLGSATYVDKFHTKEVLVMNSDLLTNVNYEDLYKTYLEKKSEIVVATVPYEVTIPYGVVETEDSKVKSLKEKPTYTYYSNAGIYIINSSCFREIPQRAFYNATDLINKLLIEKRTVTNYPIIGYWLDIGKPRDFAKAQEDAKHIQF